MKKLISLAVTFVITMFTFCASSQDRIKIIDGVYLVSYGDQVIIEDDNTQQSISMTVSQTYNDEKRNTRIYEVVCGDYASTVVNTGLKKAIITGLTNAIETGGASLIGAVSALAAKYAYNHICDYYGEQYGKEDGDDEW